MENPLSNYRSGFINSRNHNVLYFIKRSSKQINYSSWYCRISSTSFCISRINFWYSTLTKVTFILDKPGKPGTPEVKDSDKNFIEIEWDPPRRDGGAPITGYNVERKDPRTGRWNKVNRDPVTVSSDFHMIQTIQNLNPVVFFLYQQHMEFIHEFPCRHQASGMKRYSLERSMNTG